MIPILLCAEWYRTPEQTYDTEDYMVDGIKLLRLSARTPDDASPEDIVTVIQQLIKEPIVSLVSDLRESEEARQALPKLAARLTAELPFWFHITTDTSLNARPKDFNSNGFSEAQLLGVTETSSDVADTLSFYVNLDGDPLDGPPDKFMLSIGAI